MGKQLFETLVAMSSDYGRKYKDFTEEKGLKILSGMLDKYYDAFGMYTGYAPFAAYLYSQGLRDYASTFHANKRWSEGKVFYVFDETLENEIRRSELSPTCKVPASLLNQCPHSSFFVQTRGGFVNHEYEEILGSTDHPVQGDGIGFFATFSPEKRFDKNLKAWANTGNQILDILGCAEGTDGAYISTITTSMVIPPVGSEKTIEESIIYAFDYAKAYADDPQKQIYSKKYDLFVLLHALQYILFLCAENASLTERKPEKKPPSWASKKKRAVAQVKVIDVSCEDPTPTRRIFPPSYKGSSSSKGKTGRILASHIRRGHWAHRWVGSGDEKHLALRWIRETRIHPESESAGAFVEVAKKIAPKSWSTY